MGGNTSYPLVGVSHHVVDYKEADVVFHRCKFWRSKANEVLDGSVSLVQDPQDLPSFDYRSLQELLEQANDFDVNTSARLLSGYMSDAGMDEFMKLPSVELFEVMNILQKVQNFVQNEILF